MAISGSIVISVIFLIGLITRIQCASPGYSFSRFMGPVSGIEHRVEVGDGKYREHDYVAKPDYHFEYGVVDPKSMVHQKRKETRLGDSVHGEYSVLDPDGKLRTVKYTADKDSGFQASIITDGHVVQVPAHPVEPNDVDYDAEDYVPPPPPKQPHATPSNRPPATQPAHRPQATQPPHTPKEPHTPTDDDNDNDSGDEEYSDGDSQNEEEEEEDDEDEEEQEQEQEQETDEDEGGCGNESDGDSGCESTADDREEEEDGSNAEDY